MTTQTDALRTRRVRGRCSATAPSPPGRAIAQRGALISLARLESAGARGRRRSTAQCSNAAHSLATAGLVGEAVVDVARCRAANKGAGVAVPLREVQVRDASGGARLAEVVALGHVLAGCDADLGEVGVVPLVVGAGQVEALPLENGGGAVERADLRADRPVHDSEDDRADRVDVDRVAALPVVQVVARGMVVAALVGTTVDGAVLCQWVGVAGLERLAAPSRHLGLVLGWELGERRGLFVDQEAAESLPA